MATVTHYIRSHYDPKDREALQRETGQIPDSDLLGEPEVDPWQTESSFSAQRRLANAPKFIPAAISYDQINNMIGGPMEPEIRAKEERSTHDVGGWYRALTRRGTSAPAVQTGADTSSISTPHSPASTPALAQPQPQNVKAPQRGSQKKDDWFIRRVLRSEPSSVPATPPPTLADILSREPPPLPTQKPFKPPVFLALGPSNKGFAMLQQSGWNEGEALGANVVRRSTPVEGRPAKKAKREVGRENVKQEELEVQCDEDGEVTEVRKLDIVDLTLSDSEEEETEDDVPPSDEPAEDMSAAPDASSSHPTTALLTPIPTVLKSDRLGIGLKARTVGPYKASKKRVTHNQAALAAHIRASEEMRRRKAMVGRGSKGFARIAKAEEEHRKRLLASLKGG